MKTSQESRADCVTAYLWKAPPEMRHDVGTDESLAAKVRIAHANLKYEIDRSVARLTDAQDQLTNMIRNAEAAGLRVRFDQLFPGNASDLLDFNPHVKIERLVTL